MAQLLLQQGKVTEALTYFERAAELSRTEGEIVNALSYAEATRTQLEVTFLIPHYILKTLTGTRSKKSTLNLPTISVQWVGLALACHNKSLSTFVISSACCFPLSEAFENNCICIHHPHSPSLCWKNLNTASSFFAGLLRCQIDAYCQMLSLENFRNDATHELVDLL